MKKVSIQAAQGDILILKVDEVPANATPVQPEKAGEHIVAHSETGHHHVVREQVPNSVAYFQVPNEPLVSYLKIDDVFGDLVHLRDFDTHETLRLPTGSYQIRRQREETPSGWKRVED